MLNQSMPMLSAIEEFRMMDPPFLIRGSNFWTVKTTPFTFAGIREQDVQGDALCFDRHDEPIKIIEAGNVALDTYRARSNLGDRGAQSLLTPSGDEDVGALMSKQFCGR
jgi:hypothetical protein